MHGRSLFSPLRRGFTLTEVLVASTLTLVLMGSLVHFLAHITNKVSDSRAAVEMNDRLRHAKNMLQRDLLGATAPTNPPLDPDAGQGYFEIIEGPIGPVYCPGQTTPPIAGFTTFSYPGVNTLGEVVSNGVINRTGDEDVIEDGDDILMFTTMSYSGDPFTGFINGANDSSRFAEVAWFLRGTTLYRRVLLIRPDVGPGGYNYGSSDLSMHQVGGLLDPTLYFKDFKTGAGIPAAATIMPNTLGDLTKRENRFAHQPLAYPHDARCWGNLGGSSQPGLGLPTLAECSTSRTGGASKQGLASMNPTGTSSPSAGPNDPSSRYGKDQGWPFPNYEPLISPVPYHEADGLYVRTKFVPSPIAGGDPKRMMIFPDQRTKIYRNGILVDMQGPQPTLGCVSPSGGGNWDPLGGMGKSGTYYTPNAGGGSLSNYAGGRTDDIILVNVASFDVKVWDPGAPLLQVNTGATPQTVIPGDWGYRSALATFIGDPGGKHVTPVGFGAYVDLNYMQFTDIDPYAYHPSATYSAGPPPYPKPNRGIPAFANPTSRNYEAALQRFETVALGVQANNYRPLPRPKFSGPGDRRSLLTGILPGISPAAWPGKLSWCGSLASVYDTWSTHYERDGIDTDGDGVVDEGTNGVDDPENAVLGATTDPWGRILHLRPGSPGTYHDGIDDARERESPPPYPHALRGIQVKIRVFETDSKQIRELTLVHECLQE